MKFFATKAFAYLSFILLGLIALSDRHVDKHIVSYVIVFLVIFYYVKIIAPLIEEWLCLEKVKSLIMEHETALSIQRSRLITKDIYGNMHDEAWSKEIENFIENTIIKKQLTEKEKDILDYEKPYQKIIVFVEKIAKERSQFYSENIAYSENLTGIEYEQLCKNILVKEGWAVETTKTVGDQGVDLIATKNNNKVAIQCKKYSSSIGNSAVQEVIAGKDYYKAHYGVVVGNAPYTRSAKELALVHNIGLLHHNDLLRDNFFVQ